MDAQCLASSPPAAAIAAPAVLLLICGVAADAMIITRLVRRRPPWRELVSRLAGRGFPSRDSALLLALIAISATAASAWLSLLCASHPFDERRAFLGLLMQTVSFHGVALIAAFAIARRNALTLPGAFGVSRRFAQDVLSGAVLYAASMPPVLAAAWAWEWLLGLAGVETDRQEMVRVFLQPGHGPALYAAIAVTAVLAAPVVEELVFRGVALPLLARCSGGGLAVLASSALFACVHFHLPSVVPLFVLAVLLSMAYLFSGSLTVPVVMHALFNAWSLANCAVSGPLIRTGDGPVAFLARSIHAGTSAIAAAFQ